MNPNQTLHNYLINLPAVLLDYPFGDDIHVYKVEGKVFAIYFQDTNSKRLNLKCDPVLAEQLRSVFSEVTPGYHMNKKHWNTLDLSGDLPQNEVFKQIDHSYALIVKKLPKAVKQRLRIQHEGLAWLS